MPPFFSGIAGATVTAIGVIVAAIVSNSKSNRHPIEQARQIHQRLDQLQLLNPRDRATRFALYNEKSQLIRKMIQQQNPQAGSYTVIVFGLILILASPFTAFIEDYLLTLIVFSIGIAYTLLGYGGLLFVAHRRAKLFEAILPELNPFKSSLKSKHNPSGK